MAAFQFYLQLEKQKIGWMGDDHVVLGKKNSLVKKKV
jgi:hypothetical protein